jgi:cbb3-type cytochrome oxidase subunit 3
MLKVVFLNTPYGVPLACTSYCVEFCSFLRHYTAKSIFLTYSFLVFICLVMFNYVIKQIKIGEFNEEADCLL